MRHVSAEVKKWYRHAVPTLLGLLPLLIAACAGGGSGGGRGY